MNFSIQNNYYLITGIRETISHIISIFFQNLHLYAPEIIPEIVDGTINFKKIEYYLFDFLYDWKNYSTKWLDDEIYTVFGIDVYSHPFIHNKGYQIYKKENVKLFLYRYENLSNRILKEIFDFLGFQSYIDLPHDNNPKKQFYFSLYEKVKKEFKISNNLIDYLYDSKLSKHFYTEQEIITLKTHWK